MRVGIDIRGILSPHHDGSIGGGHYVFHLVRTLVSLHQDVDFVLFADRRLRHKDHDWLQSQLNVELVVYRQSFLTELLPAFYNEIVVAHALKRARLDLLHIPLSSVRIPASYQGKVILSLYDLAIYKAPEQFSSFHKARQKAIKLFNINKASAVIVPHQATAKIVQEIFDFDRGKIFTVTPGVDDRFFGIMDTSTQNIAKQYGVRQKYILAVGTVEPLKNLQRLMHAFALFRDKDRAMSGEDRSRYQLLIVGKSGMGSAAIRAFIRDLDLENDVRFVGYVPGDDLAPLIMDASCTVHTAFYEGLGLSVLESMAAKTPFALSNIPVHREISTDLNAYFFDPHDTHDMSSAIQKAVSAEWKISPEVDMGQYTWPRVAQQTIDLYRKIL